MSTEPDLDFLVRDFDPAREPGPLLRRAEQRHAELYAEGMGPDGPTRQQLAVLIELHRTPAATQSQLAAATAIDRNTLAEMLGRMARAGLVRRAPSPNDARATTCSLTDRGRATLRDALPRARAVQARILERLEPAEREPFLACLRRLAGG